MATVTLGNIKFNWKGPYNNSTAYVVDDVVSSGGSSYICILASTGNAVTNGTYWQQMSAAGTDGTDVGATLTTQGDLLYRDGSGLQRLAAGTSGYYLKTQGTGANPVWAENEGAMTKIVDQTFDSTGASSYQFTNIFSSTTDATYKGGFMYTLNFQYTAAGTGAYFRFLKSTNTEIAGSSDYTRAGVEAYRQVNQANNGSSGSNDGDGRDNIDFDGWGSNNAGDATEGITAHGFILGKLNTGTTLRRTISAIVKQQDNSNPDYVVHRSLSYTLNNADAVTGLVLKINSGNIINGQFSLWGLK